MTKNIFKEVEFTVENYLLAHRELQDLIDLNEIYAAIKLIKSKIESGSKIFTCGNGGSASTASHYVTDWQKIYTLSTGNKIHVYSLTDNIGLITAFANDLSYDEIFTGQLSSILSKDDLVIGISGSGNSMNVVNALEYANSTEADTLGILGFDGGKAIKVAKKNILIKSFDMQLVEDLHLQIGHMIMKSICKTKIIL